MDNRGAALWILLFVPSCYAAKDEVSATGHLERVMDRSITIRRADNVLIDARLLHTGKLRADILVTKFHLGDSVEIKCKAIPPSWDDDAHTFRVLELENIELLKKVSANEYFIAVSSRAWREPGNMLRQPRPEYIPKVEAADRAVEGPPEEVQNFERARAINLKYAAGLPTYVADETATRYTADSVPPHWRPLDVVLSDLTIHGESETRDQVFENNRLVQGGFKEIRGLRWSLGLAGRLRPLFDPECPVTVKYVEKTAVKNRQLLVYEFRAPIDSCFQPTSYSYLRYYAARTGKVYIDEASGQVIQLEERSSEFPKEFVLTESDRGIVWDDVKIGSAPHLLPISADQIIRYTSGQLEWVNLKYTKFRPVEQQ
jgi:hypothetical protein